MRFAHTPVPQSPAPDATRSLTETAPYGVHQSPAEEPVLDEGGSPDLGIWRWKLSRSTGSPRRGLDSPLKQLLAKPLNDSQIVCLDTENTKQDIV
ncbi:MAG: hypothetical protein KME46_34525 [Brasilonema angustatum HA4187-MV1]|nr:hypothetical protein [Brasilonema angustatum HA4187-MV1]